MKTPTMITERINAASEALKQMGRDEIAKSLAAGVPVSYSESPGMITREYPDVRKEVRKLTST